MTEQQQEMCVSARMHGKTPHSGLVESNTPIYYTTLQLQHDPHTP